MTHLTFPKLCVGTSVITHVKKVTKSSVRKVIKLVLLSKTKPFYVGAFHDSIAQHWQALGSCFYFSEQFHFQHNLSYNYVFKFSQSIHFFHVINSDLFSSSNLAILSFFHSLLVAC